MVNEQVSRHPETKWIPPRCADSSEIERRGPKAHNAVVTMALTVEVGAAVLGAIAEEVSEAVVAVASGVVGVDAKGTNGVPSVRRSARRRRGL